MRYLTNINVQFDNLKLAIDQMEAAFFWNRPAIISCIAKISWHISTENKNMD